MAEDDLAKYRSELDSSLERPVTTTETATNVPGADQPAPSGHNFINPKRLKLAALIAVVVIVGLAGLAFGLSRSKKPSANLVVNTQNLDAGALSRLESQTKGGVVSQQLTITPNTLFKNNVDVQGNLTVDGSLHLQNALTINNNLVISGALQVGGSTNIGGSLSVSGLLTANNLSIGNLTAASLRNTGDISVGGHVLTTGSAPSAQAGTSAGSGATVVVSGSDTSGTITVNTGSGSLVAGEIAIVNFHAAFKLAPHVLLTALNSDSAIAQAYVSPAASFFTINLAGNPKPGTSYSFDYWVSQ